MISEIQSYVRLRDLLRLTRMEDHDIFIQLIVGFALVVTIGGIWLVLWWFLLPVYMVACML